MSSLKRKSRTADDDDDLDADIVGESSARGAARSLAALSEATTVIKCAAGPSNAASPRKGSRTAVPLAAFPRIESVEKTDRPRIARRKGYEQACRWIDEALQEALDQQCEPLVDDIHDWLQKITAGQTSTGQRKIPVASMTTVTPDPGRFHRLSRMLPDVEFNTALVWATVNAAEAEATPRSLLTSICNQWLALGSTETSLSNPAAAWKDICRQCQGTKKPSLFVILLPCLPISSFWSTLDYLINSSETRLSVAVVVQSGSGPQSIDQLEWSEKRCLDIQRFSPSGEIDGQSFLIDLFFNALRPPPVRIPATVLRYANNASLSSATTSTESLTSLCTWLKLSIQHEYTQDETSSLQDASEDLTEHDFHPVFFDRLRLRLGDGLSSLTDLPPSLRSPESAKRLFEEDSTLLSSVPAFTAVMEERDQGKACGIELLALLCGQSAKQMASVAFTVLTSSDDNDSQVATLRKQVNDRLVPILRNNIRRSETEGGLSMLQLEKLLDEIEDWATQRLAAFPSNDEMDLDQDEDELDMLGPSTKTVGNAQKGQLHDSISKFLDAFRDFQQRFSTTNRSIVNGSQLAHVEAVELKLRTEEELRDLRKSMADLLLSTVRSLLFPDSTKRIASIFPDMANQTTAMLESLVAPSPRTHTTLALARPQVYLEHFLHAAKHQNAAANVLDPTLLSQLEQQLKSDVTSSTDLSLCYNLLLEAGGAGTGVKGRLINVFDWFGAWKTSLRLASTSSANGKQTDDVEENLQARFSLALSTLALLGYIKKTKKGKMGELLLKVGGWDLVLGADGQEEQTAIET